MKEKDNPHVVTIYLLNGTPQQAELINIRDKQAEARVGKKTYRVEWGGDGWYEVPEQRR